MDGASVRPKGGSLQRQAFPHSVGQSDLRTCAPARCAQDLVRALNYSTFRDFPEKQLLPLDSPHSSSSSPAAAGGDGGAPAAPPSRLNVWQVRHAMLVCQAVQEVNELRFVLCPK